MNTHPFPRARSTDPSTSHSAAEQADEVALRHYKKILDCLRRCGALGKDGIALHSGLESNQVARRMSELHQLGLVELTGRLAKSNAGRSEREWRFTPTQLSFL